MGIGLAHELPDLSPRKNENRKTGGVAKGGRGPAGARAPAEGDADADVRRWLTLQLSPRRRASKPKPFKPAVPRASHVTGEATLKDRSLNFNIERYWARFGAS